MRCRAADGQASASPSPLSDGGVLCFAPDSAEAALVEVGVPAERAAAVLRAAAAVLAAPPAERPLLRASALEAAPDAAAPAAPTGEGGGSAAPLAQPPWATPAGRAAWASSLHSNCAFLRSLGLSPGLVLAGWPGCAVAPCGSLAAPVAALAELGLSPAQLVAVLRSAPRLLAFELGPAVGYLRGCGLGPAALLGLLTSQPLLALGAVEHKHRTDAAAEALRATYEGQAGERARWAVQAAQSARSQLRQRGW